MLALAIHTPTRHVQATLAPEGLVAFRPPGGDWALSAPPAKQLRAERFDLLGVGDGVRVHAECEIAGATAAGRAPDSLRQTCLPLPLRFVVGDTRVEVVDLDAALRKPALEPLHAFEGAQQPEHAGPAPATLTRWFEALSTLNRWPASSQQFFRSAASLVVDPIGLDGVYLLKKNATSDSWDFLVAQLPRFEQGVWFDTTLLDCLEDPRSAWFQPSAAEKAMTTPAYVIAPWQGADGSIAGAVVGMRVLHSDNARRGVRHLEARLVRLLASTIGDIQLRREREEESLRRRVLLRQTFSADLADQIEAAPETLHGSAREVSLLFADLRSASTLDQESPCGVGPKRAFDLLSDVLESLTAEVLSRSGVVIDYYGDGLAAMWNAPFDQPDHAERACDAGLAMLEAIDRVSSRWQEVLSLPLAVGVGVHTGSAVVGDIGTRWKLKYGARGATVNLAARIERASKSLGLPFVISQATRDRLSSSYCAQRLCRARLAGVPEATSLFSVRRVDEPSALGCEEPVYAEALALFEAGRLAPALRRLKQSSDEPLRGACAFLAGRIEEARKECRGRRLGDRSPAEIGPVVDLSTA